MAFYILKPEGGMLFGTKWAYGEQVDPVNFGEGPKCPVCGAAPLGRDWLPPHRIKLSSAKPEKWGDLIWGAGFLLLVSGRFKGIYERESLTGITLFHSPAEIVRVGKSKTGALQANVPIYHHVQVVWDGANQDDAASKLEKEQPPVHCVYCRVGGGPRKQTGVVIEPGSWTGLDIFSPRGAPVRLMVSEKFKEIAETYQLKNMWLIPSERFVYDGRRPSQWYVRE